MSPFSVRKDDGQRQQKSQSRPRSKNRSKAEGGETATAASSNYSRGECQKPVTTAYKENWNAIFAKTNAKKKKQ